MERVILVGIIILYVVLFAVARASRKNLNDGIEILKTAKKEAQERGNKGRN